MQYIKIPAAEVPVACEADVCVIGGSCSGVFAAVHASRLGARVVLVEKQNRFGGMAVTAMVNLNQLAEASGVAAVQMLERAVAPDALDCEELRAVLRAGGSLLQNS